MNKPFDIHAMVGELVIGTLKPQADAAQRYLDETDPLKFNEWDDQLMRECIGGRLTEPVQSLLQAFTTMKTTDRLYDEVKALREAVLEEWRNL